ncbi:unnamed protein product [Amoebophrya sp. A25]|nr:unnamed protein product [Amoebophrya sp. A25]|eukprot:GSA25T00020166001.1
MKGIKRQFSSLCMRHSGSIVSKVCYTRRSSSVENKVC